MKKLIAFLVVMAFGISLAGEVLAQRDPAEELEAVRGYLKTLDAKIIKYKAMKGPKAAATLKKMRAEKSATLKRLADLKARVEAASVAPPPPPVAPTPPPPPLAPVVAKPVEAPAALFGLGINTDLVGQYLYTGKGSLSGTLGVKGDLVLDDFVGLGPMVGLSASAVKFKVGSGYYQGGGGLKAIPLYAGGIINLPADMLGGLESYLTGGLNYVVYGNSQTSGNIGGDVYWGFLADLGLGLGKTGFEIGYNVVRSKTVSSKGISISVSQPLVL